MENNFDLVFEAITQMSTTQIWKGWTDPKILMQWFCPRPWKVTDCKIDLRAGGGFFTNMQSPEGQNFPNHGCYLEIIPLKKLVWTNMMSADFRPKKDDKMGFAFTIKLTLTENSEGTLYRAVVSHADQEGLLKHEQMGFHEGWKLAFAQLEELNK